MIDRRGASFRPEIDAANNWIYADPYPAPGAQDVTRASRELLAELDRLHVRRVERFGGTGAALIESWPSEVQVLENASLPEDAVLAMFGGPVYAGSLAYTKFRFDLWMSMLEHGRRPRKARTYPIPVRMP